MTARPAGTVHRFTDFRLDSGGFRLFKQDRPVPLAPKALDLLLLLVTRQGSMISKDEIMRALWPDVAVTDNALTQVVSDLRQALGDDPLSPRYIETVPRRGYRFIATVDTQDAAAPPRPAAGAAAPVTTVPRAGVRETSNIDAFRAFTDGRLRLERMDPAEVPMAIGDFERAIALEPRYAPAYVGLAHARFWLFETSRARNTPDRAQLAAAIADAHRAIDLDPDLAEAHAALALMLTSAWRTHEALAAGRRAVALEPGNWRNHCRLAVAAWGQERISAFEQVLGLYPRFAFAHYGIAMVHVARRDFAPAASALRQGLPFQGRVEAGSERFPASGLHWLLGAIHLATGDLDEAAAEFERELASRANELYAAEFAVNAWNGLGFCALRRMNPDAAADMFEKALAIFPDHARSLFGLADVRQRQRRTGESQSAMQRGLAAIELLRESKRPVEAATAMALHHAVSGQADQAASVLEEMLSSAPPGFAGWSIPVDPALLPIESEPPFRQVLSPLASRAS